MIDIGRNSIVIRNINKDSAEYKTFYKRYSLYDPVQHKYTFSIFSSEGDDIYIPSSVGISSIKGIFHNEEVLIDYNNIPRCKTANFNMKNQPRDEIQRNAINFLMRLKKDESCFSRFLSLSTGSGKTYVSINVISQLKKRAIIIVDTTDLANQWRSEFLKHSDLTEDDIAIISGQESINTEIKLSNKKIYIAIHRTLSNLMTNDVNSVNLLMHKLGIGIRIFDESHVEFGNICKINSFSNVRYTIHLTATPNRSNFNDDSLYSKVFKSIPYFNGKDLDNEKYHTIILTTFDSHPSLEEKLYVKTQYGFNQARWASYIENDGYEYFLENLSKIFNKFKLNTINKKIAIMLPTISLIKKLKNDIVELFPEFENNIGIFIGEVNKNKREDELNKKLILTNNKIFGKAIDVEDLEILLNYVPIGSTVITEQILGRLRNKENMSAIYFDIADEGFSQCINQQKIRKRFYRKKSSVKKIIELNN